MKRFKFDPKFKLSISILLILTSSINAQNILSLENVLAITLKENIDLKITKNELNQVKKNQTVGALEALPRIKINSSASANKGYSSLEFATDDFPTISDAKSEGKGLKGNIEFSYNLFNGLGSIYTYQKLKKQSDLKSIELLIRIEQLLLKTAKQYYDIAYLQEQKKILNQLLYASKERYNRIKVQNEFGNISSLDLLSAEIDLNKDSINLINSEYELKVAKNQLNQILNKNLNSDFNVENKIAIDNNLIYSRLYEETLKNNNNILFQEYLIEIAKKDKKINSVAILPSVNISTQYGYTKTESNTSIIIDQTSLGLTGFINLSWDIFDRIAKRKIKQNTKIQIEKNELQLYAIKKEIEKELNLTFQQYLNSIKLINIEKRNQSISEKFFERAKTQFYQGQLGSNDFRLAQIELSKSKNRLNKTLYSAKVAELNLYRLSGEIIDADSK